MKALIAASLITISIFGAVSVHAAGQDAGHAMAASSGSSGEIQMISGEIKKVDKASGKVTVSHGPLTNLNMPAMTMVFKVANAAWVEQMKAGDRIRFIADDVNGVLTLVRFEAVR